MLRIAGTDTWRTTEADQTRSGIQPLFGAASPTPDPSPDPDPTPEPTPKPDPDPTPAPDPGPDDGKFPGPDNTGVPAGTALQPYTGPMTITKDGTVIDAKEIRGRLVIEASNVTIKRSKINGNVDSDSGSSSVVVEDTEIDAGTILFAVYSAGTVCNCLLY